MGYTEINNVTVNKLSLEQYTALRAANALNADEVYSISDIDDYLPYSLRVGRIVPVGHFIFFRDTFSLEGIPLNTDLVRMVGSNSAVITLRLAYESGKYILGAYASNSRIQTIAEGTDITNIVTAVSYISPNSGYGLYAKIDYIHADIMNMIDNIARIDWTF